jgi:general nucleoside transport system permease protein
VRRWLLALAVISVTGLAAVAVTGADPFAAAGAAFEGAFGSLLAVQETLAKATPLLWCGLAVAVAFRAGVWNIGAEGQLLVGAAAATAVALALPGGPLGLAATLAAGGVAGGLWAGIAAALRRLSGVSEVLSTILLNLVAVSVLGWAVHGPLQEPAASLPQSAAMPAASWLPRPFPPGRLHLGCLLVVIAAAGVAVALRRTRWGLELRATGAGAAAARACGVPVERRAVEALLLSGVLSGLGGAVELAGITHRLFERFSPGYGYSGIAVALLGGLEPTQTGLAALLFGAMAAGAGGMQRVAGVPVGTVLLIQGLVVVALAARRRSDGG